MYFTQLAPLLISLSSYHHLLVGAAPSALINQPQLSGHAGAINSPSFIRRGEPNTGDDFPDTDSHPNELDQVETAFADALELASFVKTYIDEDDEVFGHYFNLDDKAEVKRIFTDLYNGGKGHDKLSNIFVQKKDNRGSCSGGRTLAYMEDTNTDKPFIVLCPPAFKKKAVEALKGSDDDRNKWQAGCKEDGGDIDTHVSYVGAPTLSVIAATGPADSSITRQTMNTLGMTLLHEYMHYDGMIDSKYVLFP